MKLSIEIEKLNIEQCIEYIKEARLGLKNNLLEVILVVDRLNELRKNDLWTHQKIFSNPRRTELP